MGVKLSPFGLFGQIDTFLLLFPLSSTPSSPSSSSSSLSPSRSRSPGQNPAPPCLPSSCPGQKTPSTCSGFNHPCLHPLAIEVMIIILTITIITTPIILILLIIIITSIASSWSMSSPVNGNLRPLFSASRQACDARL